MPDRPHILVLMPDQQRGDCLSCAGHPVVRTPHMDRLAAEGVRFANATTTCPVCMPARSSFLAGTYCHNHGQWGNYGHLPADADTYLRHVKAVGYRTCHVGKSHLYPHHGDLRDQEPFMRALGWDDIREVTGPWATVAADSIMTDRWRELGCLDTFRDDYRKRKEAGSPNATWPSPMPPGETLDDFVGRTAVEYVNGYDRDEPLLLFVGFCGPHEPWDPPADWAEQYDPADMPPPDPVCEPGAWLSEKAAERERGYGHVVDATPEQVALMRARYYAKISHIDDWFGRILAAYEARGWLENTAVIFWSDHGEMLGDKGRLFKSVFYRQAATVPLIVRRPGEANAGAVSDALVQQTDCFPTILDLAGCEPKENAVGRSLAPACDDPAAPVHDAVFGEIQRKTMIRDEHHKMVLDRDGDVLLLYDVQTDPLEHENLAGNPDLAAVEHRLRDRLLRWHLDTATDQRA